MSISQVIAVIILTVISMSLVTIAISYVILSRQIVTEKKKRKKEMEFNKKVIEKVKQMSNNSVNRLILKCSYLGSVESIKKNQKYVEPEFTIKVDDTLVNIKLSDVLEILIREKEKEKKDE